jgi:hypothetical protein
VREYDLAFFCTPGGVAQGLQDVLALQVRIFREQFVNASASSYLPYDHSNRYSHTANTRLAAHESGLLSDAIELCHLTTQFQIGQLV